MEGQEKTKTKTKILIPGPFSTQLVPNGTTVSSRNVSALLLSKARKQNREELLFQCVK